MASLTGLAISFRVPALMGIVNVTPDSFSDGGRFVHVDAAVGHGLSLVEQGAGWVDVGGESTRPGAAPVSVQEELERVVPVVRGILERMPHALVSVDTSKAEVAAAALAAGARMVNDVSGLRDPEMLSVVASSKAEIAVMHMRGRPQTMQSETNYDDVVHEVRIELQSYVNKLVKAGVEPAKILVDPGVGFGKSWAANPVLIARARAFAPPGVRVLIGASRKAFIGGLTGVEQAGDRVHGSVGAACAAALAGADMIRVHDVAATHQALTVFQACR